MEQIRRAWADIEWLSVIENVRASALVGLSQSALSAAIPRWTENRLSAFGLPISRPETHPGITFVVVGELKDVTRARDAWVDRADDALGSLLGYPECCRRFFEQVWVEQRSLDTTWAMAANTIAPIDAVVVVEPSESHLPNILWRWLGVRAVPHLPCRFDCSASAHFGERLLLVGERAGYTEEVKWIREILSWPVEWSALHGIAEVKTPILKLCTRTDATAGKYVVRWKGSDYPRDGISGLRFPYRPPARRPMTARHIFHPPLKQPIEQSVQGNTWYHLDNGFSSLDAMNALHSPIVSLARRQLSGLTGNVLDLGCGNGALLAKICNGQVGLIPFGVDTNQASLVHAGTVLPPFALNFTASDIFNTESWSNGFRYALTLLMVGRLKEVNRTVAERLLKKLRAHSDAILIYSYPDCQSIGSVAQELGLMLQEPADGTAALLTGTGSSSFGAGA